MKAHPKIYSAIFLFLLQSLLFGQGTILYPGLTGQPLIDQIVADYKPATVQSYDNARDILFGEIYNQDNQVVCVYSGYTITLDPLVDPSDDALAKGMNTEHTWPRSKGAETGNALSNMYHLFPAEENVNSARSNYPFNDIDDANTERWYRNGSYQTTIPTQFIDEYSEVDFTPSEFEPREDHKGNVARAMFYFYTMYKDEAIAADPDFFGLQKNVLFRWHYLDPVDALEAGRNTQIAAYQDSKLNPFILDSTLIRRAYFTESEADIIISELMINPDAVLDADGEWVELFNPGSSAVDINGWRIRDSDYDSHVIDAGGTLEIAAGGFLVLAINGEYSLNGHVNSDYTYSSFLLGNSGDEVILEKPDGGGGWMEADRVEYGSGWTLPTGSSIVFTGTASQNNNNPAYWTASSEPWPGSAGDNGSPGYAGNDQSLPVTLTDFSADYRDQAVNLEWTTQSEIRNAGFEIYRADDPNSGFACIAGYRDFPQLAGQGNSNCRNSYQFIDNRVNPGQSYRYKLADVDFDGNRHFSCEISVFTGRQSVQPPDEFILYPNFPNPFNSATTMRFFLSKKSTVSFVVTDSRGCEIYRENLGSLNPGIHQVRWDGGTRNGSAGSGVYFYFLQAGNRKVNGKMLLLK